MTMPGKVHRSRAADAEVRPQHGSPDRFGSLSIDAKREFHVLADPGESGVEISLQNHRLQRGRRGNQRMTDRFRHSISVTVAPAFRQRSTAGGEDDLFCAEGSVRRLKSKPRSGLFDFRDPGSPPPARAAFLRFPEQRFQNGGSAIRVRKQFSVRFFVERYAEFPEEFDRFFRGKRAKNFSNDVPASAEVAVFRHDRVGDVASSSAADENFGARFFGSVDQVDREVRVLSRGENGRGQSRGARAHDRDVDRIVIHRSHLLHIGGEGHEFFKFVSGFLDLIPLRLHSTRGSSRTAGTGFRKKPEKFREEKECPEIRSSCPSVPR